MTYLIIPDGDERLVGALVTWQTSESSVEWLDLRSEWVASGLPINLLLKPATDAKAMRRALGVAGSYLTVDAKHRNMVRPVRRGRVASLVRERVAHQDPDRVLGSPEGDDELPEDDGKLQHRPLVRGIVKYGRDANIVTFEAEEGLADDATVTRMVERASNSMEALRGRVMDVDVQRWCRRLVRACGGIPMRQQGGFYFIHRELPGRPGITLWRRIGAVLEQAAAMSLHSVPAMRTADTAATVIDGLIHHVTTSCDKVQRELQTGKLGHDATVTRARQLVALTTDVEAFEALLGRNLTELRTRIESLTNLSAFTTLAATADQLALPEATT